MNNNHRIVLNQNENHYLPSPLCLEVLNKIDINDISTYKSVKPGLIETLSEVFKISQDKILIGHGSEDVLKQAFSLLLKEGDTVLLPENGWLYYQELVAEKNAKSAFYPLEETSNGFSYSITELKKLLTTLKPTIFMITSPNNPTGTVFSKAEIKDLMEAVSKDTYVIFDEAYWGFYEADYSIEDLIQYPQILLLRTFSKFFSLAGLRIGFGFVGESWKQLKIQLNRYLGFNNFSEKIAVQALRSLDYYNDIADKIKKDRDKYEKSLSDLGIKVFKTYTNFVFGRLEEDDFIALKTKMAENNIVIKFFDSKKEPHFKNCIRITIGRSEENNFVLSLFEDYYKKRTTS